ncbi:hypothetical protein MOMMJLID_CDS0052 [Arthrobacter phage 1191A]|nr:hypothetical protein MOMMJLID_CDS0052 [Arthrobacter phage 1191A]
MSHLPGNPHHALSEAAQTEHVARVHATLALAYEQRTANLIAVAKWTNGLDVASNLMDQVAERMGLKEWE